MELFPGTMVTDIDGYGLTVRDHDGATTRFEAALTVATGTWGCVRLNRQDNE
ncbi:hypothetical protein [Streptomyces decoyicus]|uniref:hypothetical protein n=1 Tax=Streptomyces decoyicus TaxID=249567 RepID=UPI003813526C